MMIRSIAHILVTLGYISYYVPAPGTVASILTGVVLLAASPLSLWVYTVILLVILLTSYYTIQCALPLFNQKDPSIIVLDECVGCLVTFYHVPHSLYIIILGLCLFRFFDITKFGIAPLQKWSQARGVLADDIAAGIISNFILQVLLCAGIIS
jgi:phosphatidylglycerophosphatase A